VNLGILCAREGKKTLLIDTDLRRPNLHRLCGCTNEEGLTSILLENKEIESVVRKSRIEGLSILPAGPAPADPGLLLKSDKIRNVIVKLDEEYDVLIFDSAPLLIKSDAITLKSYADDMVLISRNKSTTSHAISQVAGSLKNAQIKPIGIILNCL
jgi:capsular exopolysaccharide synthesis family protein